MGPNERIFVMRDEGRGQSGSMGRLTHPVLSFGKFLVLIALLLSFPASAQFFNDRPTRQPRQPAFGGFYFPNQAQQAPFGGLGEPQMQRPEWPGLSRYPGPHRRVRKLPPADYSHAPPSERQDASPNQRILVLGDAMADWLGYGLEQLLSDQSELGVVRKINTESGLLKYVPGKGDPANWIAAARQIAATEKPDAIVIMLGLNDRIAIRENASDTAAPKPIGEDSKSRATGEEDSDAAGSELSLEEKELVKNGAGEFRDARWVAHYTRVIRQMTAALRDRGVPVIWVGLPALQGQQPTSDMLFLNTLFREGAAKAGLSYVDVWEGFVDQAGRFMQYGPDFEGQTRRLRTPDGVFFTKPGRENLPTMLSARSEGFWPPSRWRSSCRPKSRRSASGISRNRGRSRVRSFH